MPRQAAILRFWFLLLAVALLGLWEPVMWFGVVPMFFWPGCPCCAPACDTCSNCQTDTTACEYEVIIAGMADEACADCEMLDDTYILTQVTACAYIYEFAGACDITAIGLGFNSFFGNYRVNGSLYAGGAQKHDWQLAAGASPIDCAMVSLDVPFLVDDSTQCNAADATFTVSAVV